MSSSQLVSMRPRGVMLYSAVILSQLACQPAATVRYIRIPPREDGYKGFDSKVLATNRELRAFLYEVADQRHWNNKEGFVKALKGANVDFQTTSLLLIRNTAGSGSVKVSLAKPTIDGKEIVFRIKWDWPKFQTGDMAYYCFAASVPKAVAKNVRIVAPLRKDVVLPLSR